MVWDLWKQAVGLPLCWKMNWVKSTGTSDIEENILMSTSLIIERPGVMNGKEESSHPKEVLPKTDLKIYAHTFI